MKYPFSLLPLVSVLSLSAIPQLSEHLSSTHFDIYYDPQDAGVVTELLAQAETDFTLLSSLWGQAPLQKIQIVLHPDALSLWEESENNAGSLRGEPYTSPDGTLHFLSPRDGWRTSRSLFQSTLLHELGHAFMSLENTGSESLPLWFREGMAELPVTTKNIPRQQDYLRDAVLTGKFPDLLKDASVSRRLFYAASDSFLSWMRNKQGEGAFKNFLTQLKTLPLEQAWSSVFQQPLSQSFNAWQQEITSTFLKHFNGMPLRPRSQRIFSKYPVLDYRIKNSLVILRLPEGQDIFLYDPSKGTLKNLTITPDALEVDPEIAGDTLYFSSSRRAMDFDLWEVHIDGTGLQLLTSFPGGDFSPRPHPLIRERIAFISSSSGNPDLFLYDARKIIPLTSTPEEETNPQWDASGDFLYFLRTGNENTALLRIKLATFQTQKLPFNGNIVQFANHPLLDVTAFLGEVEKATNLYEYVWAQNRLDQLTMDGARKTEVAWSEDGRFLAYTQEIQGQLDIYLYDMEASYSRRLTRTALDETNLQWSKRGSLYFLTGELWKKELYRIFPIRGR